MRKVGILKRLRLIEEDDFEKIKLFTRLVKELREPNIYLIERIVFFLSNELVNRAFNETRLIIRSGGCPTEDSTRLKSPGGVFFRLIRNQIPQEEFKRIWNIRRKKGKNKNLNYLNNVAGGILPEIVEKSGTVEGVLKRDMDFEDGELSEETILAEDLKSMHV
ncbi:PHAX RNA-binding domain protein [Cryptosporidium felis]|nr:PHAX RNA-binding domain protein [Cryptosporidium felis]